MLVRFSVQYPWLVIGVTTVVSVAAALATPRVRIDLDARTLVPADALGLRAHDAATVLFHVRDSLVVGVVSPHTAVRRETLERIDRLSFRIAEIPGVAPGSVLSLATVPLPQGEAERLIVRPLVPHGQPVTPDTVASVGQAVWRLGLANGTVLSRDGRVALITAEVAPDADRVAILERMQSLAEAESADGDQVLATGTALAQAALGDAVARDLLRLIPAVLGVIAVLLGLTFRSMAPPLVSLAEIGISLLWTAGVMAITQASVFVTTLVLPVVLIAVGVSDDIHVLRHYYASDRTQPVAQRIASAFTELQPAVALTALSTVVGLSSMAITPLAPLRVFGIYGSLSIAFSTLMTFTLVPALLSLIEGRRPLGHALPDALRLDALLTRLLAPRRFTVPVLALALTAASAAIVLRLRVDDRWIDNLPADSRVARADRLLNDALGGTMPLELAVDTGRADALLGAQALARLRAFEDGLRREAGIGAVRGVADDIDRVLAVARGESLAEVRGAAAQDADVAQAMLLLSSLRQPRLDRRVDHTFRHARVTALVHDASYPVIERLRRRAAIAAAAAGAGRITPFGDAIVSYETVRTLVSGQLVAIPVAALTDLALLALLLRSFPKALLAVTPVVVTGVVVFGVFAMAGVAVGIANSMFTGIALGAGTDFSIHLLAAPRDDGSARASASAVLVSSFAMAVGFAVLCLSRIQPTVQLGAAVSLTVVLCGVTAIVIHGLFRRNASVSL